MPVGFGFSIGDFIAAIKLVGTVIDALGASSKSSSELQEVLRQLHSLKIALREVEQLELDDSLHAEVLALKQSAAQCQLTISDFFYKIASYQPLLLGTNGADNLQGKWRKIKWALCKKKDVVQFKADLLAHTESIQLLLTTTQMKNLDLQHKNQQNLQRSVASQIQDGFLSCMRQVSTVTNTMTEIAAQARLILENTRRIISMNLRVFQVVLDIQNLLKTIPGQIERQQPVFLNDALGRYAPFHLEFIRSPEALISVLSINFSWLGSAPKKIQNYEFSIHDSRTRKDIDFARPWEEWFTPGQQVEMSMIFDRSEAVATSCPSCRHECCVKPEEDIECEQCGLWFRNIPVVKNLDTLQGDAMTKTHQPTTNVPSTSSERTVPRPALPSRQFEDEEDLTRYRRVRLRLAESQALIQHLGGCRLKLYELRKNEWYELGTGYARTIASPVTPRVIVTSEDDPNHIILDSLIEEEANYQKQQDVIIVWTLPNRTDMAMSFEYADDCAVVWHFICSVQQQMVYSEDEKH